jgi:hypothetical protein
MHCVSRQKRGEAARTKSHLWCDGANSERDRSGTTEPPSRTSGATAAKVMERIARRKAAAHLWCVLPKRLAHKFCFAKFN